MREKYTPSRTSSEGGSKPSSGVYVTFTATAEWSYNYQTLSNKLSKVGSELLIKVLPSIFNNACTYEKQNEEEVTFAKIIKKCILLFIICVVFR